MFSPFGYIAPINMSAQLPNKSGSSAPEKADNSPVRYFVLRSPDGGWFIFEEGKKKPFQFHRNKIVAIETVKTIARNRAPSEVMIEKGDGSIQLRYSYTKEQAAF